VWTVCEMCVKAENRLKTVWKGPRQWFFQKFPRMRTLPDPSIPFPRRGPISHNFFLLLAANIFFDPLKISKKLCDLCEILVLMVFLEKWVRWDRFFHIYHTILPFLRGKYQNEGPPSFHTTFTQLFTCVKSLKIHQ
jgi:hypothetical protein